MSGLLYRADQITDDVVSLRCHACKALYERNEHEWFTGKHGNDLGGSDGELRCTTPDDDFVCNVSGFKPSRGGGKVAERFPSPLGSSWFAVPRALVKYRRQLELEGNEVVVVLALEDYRQRGGEVFPSHARLAEETGFSVHQVKRLTASIAQKGLLKRSQPGRGRTRGRGTNRYDLEPLWERLAELVASDTAAH